MDGGALGWKSVHSHGLRHSFEAPFQEGNGKGVVGRWTYLPVDAESKPICRSSWVRHSSVASLPPVLIGHSESMKLRCDGCEGAHSASNLRNSVVRSESS